MTNDQNGLGQPIGDALDDWKTALYPPNNLFEGRYCRIEPINIEKHASDLYTAYSQDKDDRMWTYMTYGPFRTVDSVENWLDSASQTKDPLFFTLVEKKSGKAIGLASYMRIKPEHGVIEVGGISFSPLLQKTVIATETMYLMMKRAFEELGYRRYEWKCDSLNAASCRAALRFGFAFDGIFKQHIIYRGRNRDTAWYSILDSDWPGLRTAYEKWLDPENFDSNGQQKLKLADLIGSEKHLL